MLGNRASFSIAIEGVPPGIGVVRFSGQEGLSTLYEFQVEIAAGDLELSSVVGKAATLRIEGSAGARQVHGEVASIEYVGESRRYQLYELTLVPRAWKLLHRHNCRVFQHKSTPEIVAEVLRQAGLSRDDFRFALVAGYAPRNYCVQYRESDLAFVSRLLEEDGIFYAFEHGEARATMVFGDDGGAQAAISGDPVVWFNPGGELRDREHVDALRVVESVRPGKVSLRDFNFHKPEQAMDVDASAKRDVDLEVYDYPGEFQEPSAGGPHQGKSLAKIRLEALQVGRRQAAGTSDCMRLVPGHSFVLQGHRRIELNQELLLTQVSHQGNQPQVLDEDAAQGSFSYGNQFTCIDKKTPWRPPRRTPRPVVRGVQSATVVGPGAEEVFTDAQGRVLVQFHWDREGQHDENSSCWVRVSQAWAGLGWGAMFIPRVGHEVLVDFIEGDPDRPIITGRVYHANNSTPYPLPDEKTKSTIKSESSPGGGGFNELRFEDRKGGEEVFLHAQRDLNEVVLNDNSRNVTADQTFTVGGNQSFTITGNRSVSVTEGDESLTVVAGKSTTTVKMDRSVTVQSGNSSLTVQSGNNSLTVQSGTHSETVQKSISSTSKTASISLTAQTSVNIKAKTAALVATAKSAVILRSQTSVMLLKALQSVIVKSVTAKLGLSGKAEVSLESTSSTLMLKSKGKATLESKDSVDIAAPNAVAVAAKAVEVRGKTIKLVAADEISLQVGASAITIKGDGVTVSGPKINSTAIGVHEISGALIKIN
nr:type VI secretion system tip protein TssI/VgrG [Nannocystis pusilla]